MTVESQIDDIMSRTIIVPNVEAQPETIDAEDMAYHQHVISQVRRISALEAEIAAIRGGEAMWSHFLTQKYSLATGDTVNENGAIIRATG